MANDLAFNPAKTALLVMDLQTSIVENYVPNPKPFLDRVARLQDFARSKGIRIFQVIVEFRAGHPEISERNLMFGPIKAAGSYRAGQSGTEVHAALSPADDDIVIRKRRVGAFVATDLDLILRSNGMETLLMAGFATSGVVLSTVRYAADLDYRIIVVKDCCADADDEVHNVLLEKVFPAQALVRSLDDLLVA